MKTENRKRHVQVKFRLTPEERQKFTDVVNSSGMSQNDYFIQEIVNRTWIPRLSIIKMVQNNRLEITCSLGKKLVGFASCSHYEKMKQIEIHSLFASTTYKERNLMELLLNEIIDFAKLHNAESIKTILGAEPFSEWGQLPIEQEEAFYIDAGFHRMESTFANIPCMLKTL